MISPFKEEYLFPEHPQSYSGEHLDRLLIHVVSKGSSDLFIKSNDFIRSKIHSKIELISNRMLNQNEVRTLITKIYGSETAINKLGSGSPIDDMYVVKRDNHYLRFRVNITPISSGNGYDITMRTIPNTPPDLDRSEIPEEIIETFNLPTGLILVVGATGSGKSTLMASMIKDKLLNPNIYKRILSYEAPIEFVYDRVPQYYSFITQTEVPRDLKLFSIASEAALRRAPSEVFIGEMRDSETIINGINVAREGHLVYSTMHSNSVVETLKRAVSKFPPNQQNSVINDLLVNIRMIISQRLLPTLDGKRTAVREYLIIDDKIRNWILDKNDPEKVSMYVEQKLWESGYPFLVHARQRYLEGKISMEQLNIIRNETKRIPDAEIDAIIKKHKDNGHVMFQNNDL